MKQIIHKIGFQLLSKLFYILSFCVFMGILAALLYFRVVIGEQFGFNLISYYIGLIVFAIPLMIVNNVGEDFQERINKSKIGQLFEKYREPTYVEKYGADYKQPNIEDFGLTKEELTEYWKKFKIDTKFAYTMISIPIGIIILYLHATNRIGIKHFLFSIAILTFILVALKMVIDKSQLKSAKRLKQYDRVNSFLRVSKIYHEIQKEKLSNF